MKDKLLFPWEKQYMDILAERREMAWIKLAKSQYKDWEAFEEFCETRKQLQDYWFSIKNRKSILWTIPEGKTHHEDQ